MPPKHTAHTATPWGIIGLAPQGGLPAFIIGRQDIAIEVNQTTKPHELLTDDNLACIVADDPSGHGKANAALIVHRVNAFEGLVKALRQAHDFMDENALGFEEVDAKIKAILKECEQ